MIAESVSMLHIRKAIPANKSTSSYYLPLSKTIPISPLLFLSKQIQKETQPIVRQGIFLQSNSACCPLYLVKMSDREKEFVCRVGLVQVLRTLMLPTIGQGLKKIVENMITRRFEEVVWIKDGLATSGQGEWSLSPLEWEVNVARSVPGYLA
jgi:hypothetical protein